MFNYDRLKQCIDESGKTKSYLCRCLGRPDYYLKYVIRQKNSIPWNYQEILARELGTTVEYLNGLTDEKSPSLQNEKAPAPVFPGTGSKADELRRQIYDMTASMSVDDLEHLHALLSRSRGS